MASYNPYPSPISLFWTENPKTLNPSRILRFPAHSGEKVDFPDQLTHTTVCFFTFTANGNNLSTFLLQLNKQVDIIKYFIFVNNLITEKNKPPGNRKLSRVASEPEPFIP